MSIRSGWYDAGFNPTRPSARNIAKAFNRMAAQIAVSIQPDPRPGISRPSLVGLTAAIEFQSNPTLGQEYRLGPADHRLRFRRFNPTRPSARNIARVGACSLHAGGSFNPTRPSARNIAQMTHSACCRYCGVSIQPDPRPGISRIHVKRRHPEKIVSIQPDPRPGISPVFDLGALYA